MKSFSILSAAFLCAQVCVAGPTGGLVGGPHVHKLACTPVSSGIVGVHTTLEVVTQPLHPALNVQGCSLVKTAVALGNPEVARTPMNVVAQAEQFATCSADGLEVRLDKSDPYSAEVFVNGVLAYNCK